ncbi:MAG: hypothetical protein R3E39_04855 [Anaerolineae bacterium]
MIFKARGLAALFNHKFVLVLTALVMLFLLGSHVAVKRVSAQTASDTVAVINRRSANIRFGPGMQYGVLATIKKGTPLPIIGQFSNRGQIWFQVHLRGLGDYWVASWVVDINVDLDSVPVVIYKGESGTQNTGGNSVVPQRTGGGSSNATAGSSSGSSNSGSGGGSASNPPPAPAPAPATTPEP